MDLQLLLFRLKQSDDYDILLEKYFETIESEKMQSEEMAIWEDYKQNGFAQQIVCGQKNQYVALAKQN